jgi:ubiquitin carboxyl-terminal hydrolase 34
LLKIREISLLCFYKNGLLNQFQSKTYDSVTEKYLDFSFEKTNSAYMLFYEWRSNRGGYEQRDQFDTPTTSASAAAANDLNLLHQKLKETQAKQQAMEVDATIVAAAAATATAKTLAEDIAKRLSDTIEDVINISSSSTADEKVPANNETVSGVPAAAEGGSENVDSLVRNKLETENKDIDNSIIKNTNLDIVKNKCDIEINKSSSSTTTTTTPSEPITATMPTTTSTTAPATVKPTVAAKSATVKRANKIIKSNHRSLLSKELEDWIWQDNRHFLQDKNVFEHTYFK